MNKKLGWFPGHMQRGTHLIKTYLSKVDLIVNLIDSRIPIASSNLSIFNLIKQKPIVFFLGRSDLADERLTTEWINFFKNECNIFALALNCKNLADVEKKFEIACDYLRNVKKIKFGSNMIRIMVVGISNVGKSTLINSVLKTRKAKVENRPGVTKSVQWLSLSNGCSLLDTPGIVSFSCDENENRWLLQLTGAIKRSEIDVEEVAYLFLNCVFKQDGSFFEKHFDEILTNFEEPVQWLTQLAKLKGMLLKGGNADINRAANFVIDKFQKGQFGPVTLELPNQNFSFKLNESRRKR